MRLVVHAIEALHDRLLHFVHPFGGLARIGIDSQDRVVVDLRLQALRPAAIAPKPRAELFVLQIVHR